MFKKWFNIFFKNNKYLSNYFMKILMWFSFFFVFFNFPLIWLTTTNWFANSLDNNSIIKMLFSLGHYFIIYLFCLILLWFLIYIPAAIKWKNYSNKNDKTLNWWTKEKGRKNWIICTKIFGLIFFFTNLLISTFYIIISFFGINFNIELLISCLILSTLSFVCNWVFFYYFYLKVDFKKML